MATGGRFAAAVVAFLFMRGSLSVAEQATPEVTSGRGAGRLHGRGAISGQSTRVGGTERPDGLRTDRFMADVRKSVVRERAAGRAVVEQEAEPGFMLFSKRVHLVLEIEEQPAALIFRDRCRTSFVSYEGAWRIAQEEGRIEVVYELTPNRRSTWRRFVLKRLLRRDSTQMIEGLRREIEGSTDRPTNRVK